MRCITPSTDICGMITAISTINTSSSSSCSSSSSSSSSTAGKRISIPSLSSYMYSSLQYVYCFVYSAMSSTVEGNDSTGAVGDDLNCENSLSIFAGYEDGSLHVFDIRNDKKWDYYCIQVIYISVIH